MRKVWVRVLISLFLGGAVSEGIHISTGDPNRPQETNFTILYAVIAFLILTITVNIFKKKKSQ
ncbi:hypothetical protein D3C87_456970 [compost metagenome]